MLVPGLGKFLDKQHRAKQLESEQKEREDKAFWANAAQLPVKAAPTVPEPFRLSVDQGWIAQRAEVKRQVRERRGSACVRSLTNFRRRVLDGCRSVEVCFDNVFFVKGVRFTPIYTTVSRKKNIIRSDPFSL